MLFASNPGVTGTVKICQRIKQWLNERFPLQLEESALRVLQLEIDDLREQLEAANQDADIARKHASLRNEQLRDLLAALDRTPCTSCNVKLGMVQGEMPRVVQAKDGRWFCADCYDSGAHKPASTLATTKPFNSGEMAKAIESVLKE